MYNLIDLVCQACTNLKSHKYDYFTVGLFIGLLLNELLGMHIALVILFLLSYYMKTKEREKEEKDFYAAFYLIGNVDTEIDICSWWQDFFFVYENTFSNKKRRTKAKKYTVMIMNGEGKKLSLEKHQLAAFYKFKDHMTVESLEDWWKHFRSTYEETFYENHELAASSQKRANEIFRKNG